VRKLGMRKAEDFRLRLVGESAVGDARADGERDELGGEEERRVWGVLWGRARAEDVEGGEEWRVGTFEPFGDIEGWAVVMGMGSEEVERFDVVGWGVRCCEEEGIGVDEEEEEEGESISMRVDLEVIERTEREEFRSRVDKGAKEVNKDEPKIDASDASFLVVGLVGDLGQLASLVLFDRRT
jgi:hypothetical protein